MTATLRAAPSPSTAPSEDARSLELSLASVERAITEIRELVAAVNGEPAQLRAEAVRRIEAIVNSAQLGFDTIKNIARINQPLPPVYREERLG